jgi:CheY-like chemotaxis protein
MLGHGNKRTLVIVDDDPISRELLKCYAEDLNLGFLEFKDGREALEYLKVSGHRKDIFAICTDMRMVDADGLQVVEEMRSLPDWRNIPILMCSGVDREIYTDVLNSFNVQHFIQKPISMIEFQNALRAILAKHKGVAAA